MNFGSTHFYALVDWASKELAKIDKDASKPDQQTFCSNLFMQLWLKPAPDDCSYEQWVDIKMQVTSLLTPNEVHVITSMNKMQFQVQVAAEREKIARGG